MNDPVTAAEHKWREILSRQQASGLSIAEFCRDNAVPVSSFFAWKRRVSGGGPAQGGRTPSGPNPTVAGTFVEPKLVSAGLALDSSGAIEVRLRGGRRVLVRRGFDRELLARVVAVLEGRPFDSSEGLS
jgi:hypothetical protein